jgi:hypothetical protein
MFQTNRAAEQFCFDCFELAACTSSAEAANNSALRLETFIGPFLRSHDHAIGADTKGRDTMALRAGQRISDKGE